MDHTHQSSPVVASVTIPLPSPLQIIHTTASSGDTESGIELQSMAPPKLQHAHTPTLAISAKASDLLFGGQKSLSRPSSLSWSSPTTRPTSKRHSLTETHTNTGNDAEFGRVRNRDGKVYDILGETKAFIETFRDNPKAMAMLGVLDSHRHRGATKRKHIQSITFSERWNQLFRSTSINTQPHSHERLVQTERVSRRTIKNTGVKETQSATPIDRTRVANTSTGNDTHLSVTNSGSNNEPLSAPALSSSPLATSRRARSPMPRKAADVLFGSKPRIKVNDRLGMSVAMMDRFAQHPKAFQRLGLFDSSDSIRDKRMNVNGVVISGMRQLKCGYLFLLIRRGPLLTIRKRYFVLTLDSLTFYANESIAMPEGEINLLHGALVKRAGDVTVTRRTGLARQTISNDSNEASMNIDTANSDNVNTAADAGSAEDPADNPSSSINTPNSATSHLLYGFTVTPLRSIHGDTRSYHLLSSDRVAMFEWLRSLQSTLRRGRHRSGVLVHNSSSSSRSSMMPHELNYLHMRSNEGYLFYYQQPLTLSSIPMVSLTSQSSTVINEWQPRYVIVTNSHLTVFANVDDTTPAARARGKFPLLSMSLREAAILDSEPTEDQSHVFVVIGHRVHNRDEHHRHKFAAASDEDKLHWMRVLTRVANNGRNNSRHCSSTVSESKQASESMTMTMSSNHTPNNRGERTEEKEFFQHTVSLNAHPAPPPYQPSRPLTAPLVQSDGGSNVISPSMTLDPLSLSSMSPFSVPITLMDSANVSVIRNNFVPVSHSDEHGDEQKQVE